MDKMFWDGQTPEALEQALDKLLQEVVLRKLSLEKMWRTLLSSVGMGHCPREFLMSQAVPFKNIIKLYIINYISVNINVRDIKLLPFDSS